MSFATLLSSKQSAGGGGRIGGGPGSGANPQVRRLKNEITAIDTRIKSRIHTLSMNAKSEKDVMVETRKIKDLINELAEKIHELAMMADHMTVRGDVADLKSQVAREEKELTENRSALRSASQKALTRIAESNRSALLDSDLLEMEIRKRRNDEKSLHDSAAQSTTRLSEMVSKMGERVHQSEEALEGLVHSSSVLGKAHEEFTSQSAHIQTGSKLLSKYERRELSDKILVFIALMFYFAVLYYILQKRVLAKFWFFW